MFVAVSVGFADRMATPSAPNGQQCELKEDGNFNVNFNLTETDVAKIKPMIDAKLQEVTAEAEKMKDVKIELQSMNYSANSNNNGGGCNGGSAGPSNYQVYGNFSLKVTPASKASALMEVFAAKGYNTSFNVNAYRQCQ